MNILLNEITTGDARELSKNIPDESIDLIFTDPPYPKEFLPLYGWLAEEAKRILKPGGFLLTYTASLWKYEIFHDLGKHLEYFYDFISWEPGHISMLHTKKIAGMHKSIVAFSKGPGLPQKYTFSLWKSTIENKRYHAWGQNESTAAYYIGCFSKPKNIIWEPFTGGGTVPCICKQIDRQFIAFEIDSTTADIARKRLSQVQMPLPGFASEQLTFEAEANV